LPIRQATRLPYKSGINRLITTLRDPIDARAATTSLQWLPALVIHPSADATF
jgi:hypothetical protein